METDPLYGPVDDDVYRSIEASGHDNPRFLYDATLVAVNYDTHPDQLNHLVHKWCLSGDELAAVKDLISSIQGQSGDAVKT